MPREVVPVKAYFLALIVALALLPSKSTRKCGDLQPHQVMRKLGYDQEAIMIAGEMAYSSDLNAEARFIDQGKDQF